MSFFLKNNLFKKSSLSPRHKLCTVVFFLHGPAHGKESNKVNLAKEMCVHVSALTRRFFGTSAKKMAESFPPPPPRPPYFTQRGEEMAK